MTTAADLRRVLELVPDDTPVDRYVDLELLRAEVPARLLVGLPRHRGGIMPVLEEAARVLDVPLPHLLKRQDGRRSKYAWQKRIAAYAVRRVCGTHSYPEIATALGWGCHTSAMDACSRVAEVVRVSPEIRALVEEIVRRAAR